MLIDLRNNECINEEFTTAARIAEMPRLVNAKCGFEAIKNENLQSGDVETHLTKIAKLEAELKTQAEEMTSLKLENAKLDAGKAQADLQVTMMKEFHDEAKAQLKETFAARMELKVQENANLSNDLQLKMAIINENNEKIKQCEKKIQVLGGESGW